MLTPRDLLLRLHALQIPGIALLESAGEKVEFGRYSFLSAAPTRVQNTLPERPDSIEAGSSAIFPAWIGGLTYEAEHHWAYYPSGIVWDRLEGTFEQVGESHLDWDAVFAVQPNTLEKPVVGTLKSDFPQAAFEAGVLEVQNLILAGECYQVNLSHRLRSSYQGHPLYAYLELARTNPSPFMAYLENEGFTIASSSPERLVLWTESDLSSRPIAGTRRRGETPAEEAQLEEELLQDEKERSEHVMLLDLERNDLGRVATPGSVWVGEFMTVEFYSHVMHLVSEVRATAQPDLTLECLLDATFPGGTITGAPKKRVMEAIATLEPTSRGWYTGSVGILSGPRADFNILIRTLAFYPQDSGNGWEVHLSSGAGIVMDSIPAQEYRETRNKAAAMLAVLGGGGALRPAQNTRPPTFGPSWRPAQVKTSGSSGQKVLLLDNFDSFTYNIVQDLLSLGAEVTVRPHTDSLESLRSLLEGGTALLLGPGPGTPMTSGVTMELASYALNHSIPTLGVCLGHQALGELVGARLLRAPYPVHGKLETLTHNAEGLFEGIPQGAGFTRYHSLIVRDLPSETARAIARSSAKPNNNGGELMALEVLGKPAWGVQFHPESVLSDCGRTLLANWLRLVRESV